MAAKPMPNPQPISAERTQNPCERGLELKIQMADLEAEYAELKPAIEAWCEAHGGTYNSALGSYSTRFRSEYQYPQEIELKRIELKQAEERARADGSAAVVNTAVSVAATIIKNSRQKAKPVAMAAIRRGAQEIGMEIRHER